MYDGKCFTHNTCPNFLFQIIWYEHFIFIPLALRIRLGFFILNKVDIRRNLKSHSCLGAVAHTPPELHHAASPNQLHMQNHLMALKASAQLTRNWPTLTQAVALIECEVHQIIKMQTPSHQQMSRYRSVVFYDVYVLTVALYTLEVKHAWLDLTNSDGFPLVIMCFSH